MKKDKNKIKHNYLNLYGAGVQSGYQDQGACRPGGRGCHEAHHPVTGCQAGCEVGSWRLGEAVTWSTCCRLDMGPDNTGGTLEDAEDNRDDDDDDDVGDDCGNLGNQTLHNTHYTLLKQCIISQTSLYGL